MKINEGICYLSDDEQAVSACGSMVFLQDFDETELADKLFWRQRALIGLSSGEDCLPASEQARMTTERALISDMVELVRLVRE